MAIVEVQWADCVYSADGTRARVMLTYDDAPDGQGRMAIQSLRCINDTPITVAPYVVDTSTSQRLSADVAPHSTGGPWNVPNNQYFLTQSGPFLKLPTALQVGINCKG